MLGTVKRIDGDWCAHCCEVDADLVRTAGKRVSLDERVRTETLQHAVVGGRWFPAAGVDKRAMAAVSVGSER